jgi:hypothetical protein
LRDDKIIQPSPSNSGVLISGVPISRAIKYPEVIGRRVPAGVYEINISPPPEDNSFWLDCGGVYDQFTGTQIILYYSRFLEPVEAAGQLFSTPYSFYIDKQGGAVVYLNIPKHPHLYPYYSIDKGDVAPFLSSALNPDKPSDNKIRGVTAQTRLEIPDFTVKLSDNISGVTLNQGFSLNFHNNDGYFDDEGLWDLYNTPVYLKKATADNPSYEDFHTIRSGNAEDTRTTFGTFTVNVSDKLRGMGGPVCNVIKQDDYINIKLLPDATGKNLPVVYGDKRVDVIKISDTPELYIACENITKLLSLYDNTGSPIFSALNNDGTISFDYSKVSAVYDKDRNKIKFTPASNGVQLNEDKTPDIVIDIKGGGIPFKYDRDAGLIKYPEAKTAYVTGCAYNNIGQVIKDIITRKTTIQYNNSNWNTEEIELYISTAAKINIAFSGGDVKTAVHNALKSDMAYFIQQTDGRFTIRKYGCNYICHKLKPWMITQKPEKDFSKAQQNYFSSCLISYNYISNDGKDGFDVFLFDEEENAAEDRYKKKITRTFDTDLISKTDACELAKLLGGRFTVMRQTLKLPLGVDTSKIELMDTVIIDMDINSRNFSKARHYAVTEINPAQDIITCEELYQNDFTGEYADTVYYDADFDNGYADTPEGEFVYELDGGGVDGW